MLLSSTLSTYVDLIIGLSVFGSRNQAKDHGLRTVDQSLHSTNKRIYFQYAVRSTQWHRTVSTPYDMTGCSTVVLMCFTCPAITVATGILRALDRVRERVLGLLCRSTGLAS